MFTQTKVEANDIILSPKMRNSAEVLHGDIAQKQREVTLRRFKEGKFNVLVATDVAARGLDIPNVDLIVQLEPPKDIESYIHRSGRTARAGKDGMCITFYTGRQYNTIQDIENLAGIRFKKITPPKNEDVVKVASADVITHLKNVDKKVIPIFEDAATKFIEEVGAKEALCMALAYISDTSNSHLAARSFLSGEDGLVTYILKSNRGINNISYGHKLIQNNFSREIAVGIKGVKLLKSGEGIVFDLSEEIAEVLDQEFKEQACTSRGLPFTLERASEMPEIDDGSRYGKSSGGYGKRNYDNDYNGGGSRGYGKKDYSYKNNDKYESRQDKNNFDSGDMSGFNFRSKPQFFGKGDVSGDAPRPQTEHKSLGEEESGSGGYSRGGRGGYRGRGDYRRGRGEFRGGRGDFRGGRGDFRGGRGNRGGRGDRGREF